jgi:hypothetical protein
MVYKYLYEYYTCELIDGALFCDTCSTDDMYIHNEELQFHTHTDLILYCIRHPPRALLCHDCDAMLLFQIQHIQDNDVDSTTSDKNWHIN